MAYGAAVIVGELASLELAEPSPAAAAVYDRPIALRLLHQEPGGEEHYLVRYPAGLTGRTHLHTAAHTIVVLDGQLDVNGRVVGSGSYAHFPAGQVMRHQAAGAAPCLFVLLFHGPFDVHLADEETIPQTSAAPPSPDHLCGRDQ
jgi:quercetin dioxygenase-like cupin family protein